MLYDPIYRTGSAPSGRASSSCRANGGALIVANHAGAIPSDAPAIMHGIETRARPAGLRPRREPVPLHARRRHPVVARRRRRRASRQRVPAAARRTSTRARLPRGHARRPASASRERYQLRRFGRGGFVEIAMRAGVPVIPIAVVGAEESMPIVFKSTRAREDARPPLLPDHREHARCSARSDSSATSRRSSRSACCRRCTSTSPPNQERYSRSRVMEESERIRRMVQEALYDMLRTRRSVWFG